MNETSDGGGERARACGEGRVIYACAILRGARWRSGRRTRWPEGRRGEGASERVEATSEAARWEKGLGAKNAERSECVSQLLFPSFFRAPLSLSASPSRVPPHPAAAAAAAATVFLSSSCLVRPSAASVPLPPVARLLIRKVSEDEGSSVAKKFGYFAIPLVNKLRHTQYVLVRREASSQAGVKCSSRRNFLRLRYRPPALSPFN